MATVPPQQPVPVALTGMAVTRTPMSIPLLCWHWTMIVCTVGLWWPVYAAGKRKRRAVTTYTA